MEMAAAAAMGGQHRKVGTGGTPMTTFGKYQYQSNGLFPAGTVVEALCCSSILRQGGYRQFVGLELS